MNRDLSLALWQVRYEQRAFWRNRRAAFFSFAFPLLLLVFIGSFGADSDQFIPGILAYGVAMATYSNLAISFAVLRDTGIIRRVQGTPLPWWTYLAGRIGSTSINAALMTVITLVIGILFFDVSVSLTAIPGIVATLVLAVLAFTGLGIGVVRYIGNADTAPVVANFTVLPISFISGVFAPIDGEPEWLQDIAKAFPIEPLGHGLRAALGASDVGAGLAGGSLGVLAIWVLVGAFLSARFLRGLVAHA